MKKFLLLLFVVLLVCGTMGTAGALTLSSVEGAWSNAVGGTNINYFYDVAVAYGNQKEDQVKWGDPASSAGQSGLGFTGIAPPASVFGIGSAFQIGQLRHFNNPIYTAVSAVDLAISLTFSDPAGLNDSFDFTFTVNETPNNNGGASPADDDFIFFPSSYANETFTIGGVAYTLELLGFGDSADDLVAQFQSPEGGTNSTLLWGRITTPPSVPEPATMLLLGFGLAGLLGFRRKLMN